MEGGRGYQGVGGEGGLGRVKSGHWRGIRCRASVPGGSE